MLSLKKTAIPLALDFRLLNTLTPFHFFWSRVVSSGPVLVSNRMKTSTEFFVHVIKNGVGFSVVTHGVYISGDYHNPASHLSNSVVIH